MEVTFDTLINIATLLLGSGGGAFFTWKWISRKSKAEAEDAEVTMAQKVQDTYQQMLEDKQKEVEDKNRFINELRQDRDHLRTTVKSYDVRIEDLERRVARNGRMVESLRPFICTNLDCKLRHRATISAAGEIDTTEEEQPANDNTTDTTDSNSNNTLA